ncbi:MAG: cytochrome ubiquinol oxidase subunit I [Candidatus Sumerlaeaceae bacterium]|nr:cytochrome ubiquinol oxidase subunit I [Candidatus Sumerlaeaceae bacterium]
MDLDPVFLARLQFAFTVMFHYLFPPLTIGLGAVMVITESAYMLTKNPLYETSAKFWTKIFAVTFAMGVASGIVMEFQFGTNWATYSRFVGDVFGSALAAEGVFAFFLESGFLAVLVFGWDRVSPRVHFFSTIMVFLGSVFSAVWIVVANSWQQTPAGFHLVQTADGLTRAEITDFWAMVFNPSSMLRLSHVLVGSFILGAFFVMSVTAFYILRGKHLEFAKRSFTFALVFAVIVSIGQLLVGHEHAQQVAETQPAKLAAYEGLYQTPEGGAPLTLFGVPNDKEQRLDYAIAIPGLLSFLVHGDFNTPVPGLDQTKPEDRPPVALPFYSYHIMVGLGMFFIGITLLALMLLPRGRLFEQRWLLWIFVFAVIGPYLANHLGWVAAEVGRQPWSVYGLLRTADSVSKSVTAPEILTSLIMFGFIYSLLFAVWVFVLNDKIQKGPDEPGAPPPDTTTLDGLMEAATGLESGRASMTSAKDPGESLV